MAPKVFLSHASEDKSRFVLKFAERLREKGIDVWLDKWEMLPGDSLVDKIFEEGIKGANAVVVVLSKFSVGKPWVKEEINAAFVKRINNGSKLIPVVIDDCPVPEALMSTLWERIEDLSNYQTSIDRIVASVFGTSEKPSLGSPPLYVKSFDQLLGSLNNIDSLVLRLSCEELLKGGKFFLDPAAVFTDQKLFIPESELCDSLEILEREGHIKLLRTLGARLSSYEITTFGFETYANVAIPDYQSRITAVVSAIVNEKLVRNIEIQSRLKESLVLVDHILCVLDNNGHIELVKMLGGGSEILRVSPTLRRALSNA